MANGHRGNLGIGGCGAPAFAIAVAHKAAPYGGSAAVKGQDTPFELPGEILLDPSLESFAAIPFLDLPGASNELSDGLGGKEEVRRVLGFDPVQDELQRARFDRFADHIGVD